MYNAQTNVERMWATPTSSLCLLGSSTLVAAIVRKQRLPLHFICSFLLLPPAGIFYTDREGNVDDEYLSLGVDKEPLFGNRTPLDIYRDWLTALRNSIEPFIPYTVNEVQVGMGPAGELRYPGYQLDKWHYCGIGEFQCYDKYMLNSLKQSAIKIGQPQWGNGGPSNAGTYNYQPPQSAQFFADGSWDNYASSYGQFFLCSPLSHPPAIGVL